MEATIAPPRESTKVSDWAKPMEAAYALAFQWYLLIYLFRTVHDFPFPSLPWLLGDASQRGWSLALASAVGYLVDSGWMWSSSEVLIRGYLIAVAAVLSFQLLRMYYHLHTFEVRQGKPNKPHFLDSLNSQSGLLERLIRLGLAVILIVFGKFYSEVMVSRGVFIMPALVLFVCFATLILWDVVVFNGLRLVAKANQLSEDATKGACEFFYMSYSRTKTFSLDLYFKGRKFFERILGLAAGMFALLFVISLSGASRVMSAGEGVSMVTSAVFSIFMLVGMVINYHKACSAATIRIEKRRFVAIVLSPILTLLDLARGTKMDHQSRSVHQLMQGAVMFLFVVILVGISQSSGCSQSADERRREIRIATSKNLWCALTLLAHDRGYFEEVGLDVEMNYQAAGRLNMDALLGGAVDIANVVETNVAYQALSQTKNLSVVSRIVRATDYAIVTKKSAAINSIADLKGKRISFGQATGAESYLFWQLERAGLDNSSVKLIPLQPAGLVDHFAGEGSDAVVTWEPFVSSLRARIKSLGAVFKTDTNGFTGIMTVAVRSDWARQNASVLTSYHAAMVRASRFISDSTTQAQEILARESGLPINTVKSIWSNFDFGYERELNREKLLVKDVVKRITSYVPEMSNKQSIKVDEYFN